MDKAAAKRPTPKTCVDYPDGPACCSTCHSDADEYWPEYALSEVSDAAGNVIAEVCCAKRDYAQEREVHHEQH